MRAGRHRQIGYARSQRSPHAESGIADETARSGWRGTGHCPRSAAVRSLGLLDPAAATEAPWLSQPRSGHGFSQSCQSQRPARIHFARQRRCPLVGKTAQRRGLSAARECVSAVLTSARGHVFRCSVRHLARAHQLNGDVLKSQCHVSWVGCPTANKLDLCLPS